MSAMSKRKLEFAARSFGFIALVVFLLGFKTCFREADNRSPNPSIEAFNDWFALWSMPIALLLLLVAGVLQWLANRAGN